MSATQLRNRHLTPQASGGGYAPPQAKTIGQTIGEQVQKHHNSMTDRSTCKIILLILILILLLFVSIVTIIWLAGGTPHCHDAESAEKCNVKGNDCFVGMKSKTTGRCVAPETRPCGAKCSNKCFVPEEDVNGSENEYHQCLTQYDHVNKHEVTECLGTRPFGTCVEVEDCESVFNTSHLAIDVSEGFSSGFQTRCDNGTCVWEVDPFVPPIGETFPTGCTSEPIYLKHCAALIDPNYPLKDCMDISVLCRGPFDDLFVVDNCRYSNVYGYPEGGSFDPDFNLFFP